MKATLRSEVVTIPNTKDSTPIAAPLLPSRLRNFHHRMGGAGSTGGGGKTNFVRSVTMNIEDPLCVGGEGVCLFCGRGGKRRRRGRGGKMGRRGRGGKMGRRGQGGGGWGGREEGGRGAVREEGAGREEGEEGRGGRRGGRRGRGRGVIEYLLFQMSQAWWIYRLTVWRGRGGRDRKRRREGRGITNDYTALCIILRALSCYGIDCVFWKARGFFFQYEFCEDHNLQC